METIKIKPYKKGQESAIYHLIKKVYDEFVSKEYTNEGNEFFYNWISPEKIADRQKNKNNLWIATEGSKIVGMIEIRENKNISLLFVEKNYQGQGIATKLFKKALMVCIQRDPSIRKFYVHASMFSIPVYRKMGFAETNIIQEENGIKYLPMEMIISQTI